MSNRRLSPNQSKPNRRQLTNRARTIIAAILLSGGVLSPGMMAWANSPAPGTIIRNQATGSFVDPSDSSTQTIISNEVQVEVAEVAGITVVSNGYNEPTDGTVNEGDTVYVDFVITNVGNDPTQFVLPGSASVTNGTQAGDIQIIEYDADGIGAGAAVDLTGNNITVPGGGETTGNLLSGVASANNGSIPAGASITVRVPVTAGTAGNDLTVTLGDTAATDGQNEAYVAGSNDVYTQDNSGTDNGDTTGAPINGEREAEDSLTVEITAALDPNVLLVKRITALNGGTTTTEGDDIAQYLDEASNPYDDNDITVADPVNPGDPPKDTDQWPDITNNLLGGINGGNVMPNDEIEYTIYFLSSGDTTAENVLFCDYIPTFTTFIPNAYTGNNPQATGGIGGADLSIELFRNGTTDYHTGANDGDSATYFAPGVDPANSFPDIDCDGDGNGSNANPNGAVVVNLGDLPDATTNATGAYGHVKFRARVK
ncbi:hypothetical protein SPB21_29750 [Leptothoe sp. ISB3NOV94-8A]|nr:hypothetical protein [Adonisia turfae]MDV3348530.1 hypothetical protein [Leptothoe sp. LEGE 181152]